MWEVHFTHNELGKIKISARKTVTLFVRRLFLLLYTVGLSLDHYYDKVGLSAHGNVACHWKAYTF